MGAFTTPTVAEQPPASSSAGVSSHRMATQPLLQQRPAGAMINANRTQPGYPAGSARPSGLGTPRSPWLVVILGALTGGIYYLYWLNTVAQELCAARDEDTPNPVKLVLLTLLTAGVYAWYWRGTAAGEQIAEAQSRAGVSPAVDLGVIAMVPFYGVYAMQRELNRLAS